MELSDDFGRSPWFLWSILMNYLALIWLFLLVFDYLRNRVLMDHSNDVNDLGSFLNDVGLLLRTVGCPMWDLGLRGCTWLVQAMTWSLHFLAVCSKVCFIHQKVCWLLKLPLQKGGSPIGKKVGEQLKGYSWAQPGGFGLVGKGQLFSPAQRTNQQSESGFVW